MSRKSDWSDPDHSSAPKQVQGFFTRKVTRFLLCIGLAAGLAAASPIGGTALASAAPVAAGHHSSRGGGGDRGRGEGQGYSRGGSYGGGFNRNAHHRKVSVDGSVLSGGAGANFTLTATSSTVRSLRNTAVTVDVTSSTTYKQPGVSSPSVAIGDYVIATGTETGTASTITAKSVDIPAVQLTGDVTSGGSGGNFTLTTTSSTIYGPKGTAVTINVNAGGVTTKYREKGVQSPSVAIGDKVQVSGSQAGAATVNAALVVITAPPTRHRHHANGYGGGGNGYGGGGNGYGGGGNGYGGGGNGYGGGGNGYGGGGNGYGGGGNGYGGGGGHGGHGGRGGR